MKSKWFAYNSTVINLDEICLLNFERDSAEIIFKNCFKSTVVTDLRDIRDFADKITKAIAEREKDLFLTKEN
jgi:hypothetical protein